MDPCDPLSEFESHVVAPCSTPQVWVFWPRAPGGLSRVDFMGSTGGRVCLPIHELVGKYTGQIIATFPAGWSPQMVVKSKGIPPKSPEFRFRIYNQLPK